MDLQVYIEPAGLADIENRVDLQILVRTVAQKEYFHTPRIAKDAHDSHTHVSLSLPDYDVARFVEKIRTGASAIKDNLSPHGYLVRAEQNIVRITPAP